MPNDGRQCSKNCDDADPLVWIEKLRAGISQQQIEGGNLAKLIDINLTCQIKEINSNEREEEDTRIKTLYHPNTCRLAG